VVAGKDQDCDCPVCSGEVVDPDRMLAELVDDAVDLAEVEDPLETELAGALFVAMVQPGDDALGAFADGLIPAIEARAAPASRSCTTRSVVRCCRSSRRRTFRPSRTN
jgi:hypothetical protein